MKRFVGLGLLAVTGCAAHRLPHPQATGNVPTYTEARRVDEELAQEEPIREEPVQEGAVQPSTPPSDATLLAAESPEVQAAVQQYTQTGEAPVIEKKSAQFVQYPFGLSQPVVSCQPLRMCTIQLQPGEQVVSLASGDQERWVIQPLYSGPASSRTTTVVVKPTEVGISTDLVIGTDRRKYHLALVARGNAYMREVRFYYPQEMVQQFTAHQQRQQEHERAIAARLPAVAVEDLDYGYTITGDATWRPTLAFSDGKHTYLKMPADLHTTEAPALFLSTPTGDTALVNYRVRAGYYVLDAVPDQAVLVRGVGNAQQRVVVTRQGRSGG